MQLTKEHLAQLTKHLKAEGSPKIEVAPLSKAPAGIPDAWAKILTHKTPTKAVWDLWKPMAKELPKTLKLFQKSLHAVALCTTKTSPPSLLYIVTEGLGDDAWAMRGFAAGRIEHAHAKALAPDFLKFFEQVHDGWCLPWQAMGPLPVAKWYTLSNDPKAPAGRFLAVFQNGGGAHMGWDLDHEPPVCHIVWPDDKPELVPQIWKRMDKWMFDQFESIDPA